MVTFAEPHKNPRNILQISYDFKELTISFDNVYSYSFKIVKLINYFQVQIRPGAKPGLFTCLHYFFKKFSAEKNFLNVSLPENDD